MNTPLDTDPQLVELFALVRVADPMRDPRVEADIGVDTEAALRLLRSDVDRRPAPRRRRPRRTAVRAVVLACVVAAAAFVVANLASGGDGSAIPPAQAQILKGVRAALVFPPNAIYDEKTVGAVTARDGATHTSGWQEWLSTSPPYNGRIIEMANGKILWEQSFVSGRLDLYDPTTNTIYLAPGVAPNQTSDTPQSTSALSEVQSLLTQPASQVKVNPNAILDGKSTIELTSDRGRFSYWISPNTYQPLQSEDRSDSLPDGQGGVGIDRYPIVRVLTGRAASPNLLSLQAQHPTATVDHNPTDYAAALHRLIYVRGAQT